MADEEELTPDQTEKVLHFQVMIYMAIFSRRDRPNSVCGTRFVNGDVSCLGVKTPPPRAAQSKNAPKPKRRRDRNAI